MFKLRIFTKFCGSEPICTFCAFFVEGFLIWPNVQDPPKFSVCSLKLTAEFCTFDFQLFFIRCMAFGFGNLASDFEQVLPSAICKFFASSPKLPPKKAASSRNSYFWPKSGKKYFAEGEPKGQTWSIFLNFDKSGLRT